MESGKKRVASEKMMEVASGDEASSDGSDLENDLDDLDEEEEDEEEDIDELQDLLEEEEIHGLTHRHGADQDAKSIGHPSSGETCADQPLSRVSIFTMVADALEVLSEDNKPLYQRTNNVTFRRGPGRPRKGQMSFEKSPTSMGPG